MSKQFEQLIQTKHGLIHRIARKYSNVNDEHDLYQEILMQLWRSFASFRNESKVDTWIYRIAFNTAMTYVKKTIKNRELEAELAKNTVSTPMIHNISDPAEILSSFLTSLNKIDACLLIMYLDGLSTKSMSDIIGMEANAIDVRINRIKNKFSDTYVDKY